MEAQTNVSDAVAKATSAIVQAIMTNILTRSLLELYSSQSYSQCELNNLYYLYSSSTDDLVTMYINICSTHLSCTRSVS